jgi:dihydroorotate dehydrogenase (fumarate)
VTELSTKYLGLDLRSPLVASAGPLTGNPESLLRLEEAGAAAVVLPSLFEEQITHESLDLHSLLEATAESFPEAATYFSELDDYNTGPRAYLDFLEAAKDTLSIPVIASLNGSSDGGWVRYGRSMQEAGADAIELNIYFLATDPDVGPADIEARYLDVVSAVRQAVSVPLAVKVGPYFSAMANMARRLVDTGADGLVLFNRFYQPDFDVEALEVVPRLVLSTSEELRLPLRWIAILYGRVRVSLAATTGVHSGQDVAKLLLAGADVTMMTSALLRNGPQHIANVEEELLAWMAGLECSSVGELRGSMSQLAVPNPEAFERANYMQMLTTFTSAFFDDTDRGAVDRN